VLGQQSQQAAGAGSLGGVHLGVVEHHADGAVASESLRQPLLAIRLAPVDADRDLAEPGQAQRLGPVLAGEGGEAEVQQAAARLGSAAVPRRREDRVDAVAQEPLE